MSHTGRASSCWDFDWTTWKGLSLSISTSTPSDELEQAIFGLLWYQGQCVEALARAAVIPGLPVLSAGALSARRGQGVGQAGPLPAAGWFLGPWPCRRPFWAPTCPPPCSRAPQPWPHPRLPVPAARGLAGSFRVNSQCSPDRSKRANWSAGL